MPETDNWDRVQPVVSDADMTTAYMVGYEKGKDAGRAEALRDVGELRETAQAFVDWWFNAKGPSGGGGWDNEWDFRAHMKALRAALTPSPAPAPTGRPVSDYLNDAMRRVGAAIPQEAMRRGWALSMFRASMTADGTERWEVDILGPDDIRVEERILMDGKKQHRSTRLLPFSQRSHGTIWAHTLDGLLALIAETFNALLGAPTGPETPA